MFLVTGLYRIRKLFDKLPPSRLVDLLLAGFFRLRKLISPKPVFSFLRGLVGWNSASEIHERWTEKEFSNSGFDIFKDFSHHDFVLEDFSHHDFDILEDFPRHDFKRLNPAQPIEEENYGPENFYPVHIGEVLASRYKVVGKLGFGATATVWLARDLEEECRYVELKVYIQSSEELPELAAYKRLEKGPENHPGRNAIRGLLDSFIITGHDGEHHCLVHEPVWNDLNHWLSTTPDPRLSPHLLTTVLKQLFLALDYAKECQVIHTDINGNNIMFTTTNTTLFEQYEKREREDPTPRKEVDGRIIYLSRPIEHPRSPTDIGVPVLCGFGASVWGGEPQHADAQTNGFRSPEVILKVPWSYEIDIWNVGCLAWLLSQGRPLLSGYDTSLQYHRDTHLSRMIGLLGPPSPEFLARGSYSSEFFSSNGEFIANVGVAPPVSLADLETTLKAWEGEGVDRDLFLRFIGKMLQWDPRDRPTAKQLLEDEWLTARLSKGEETK